MANSAGRLDPDEGTAFDPTNIHGKMDTVIPIENLEGGITAEEEFLNTLDEPVLTTIKRDAKYLSHPLTGVFAISNKLFNSPEEGLSSRI
ncbi:hypothetical protein LOD99_12545 [Oopsacas minuta]|uniref:Uncharacterized protein n=1 Tax=Oopsacas minuta TaxID=111878 RepID=A0AAV7JCC7_9METZ|nr:hypothetical protein LOD99_12545 [Oopsacas minuta]